MSSLYEKMGGVSLSPEVSNDPGFIWKKNDSYGALDSFWKFVGWISEHSVYSIKCYANNVYVNKSLNRISYANDFWKKLIWKKLI